MAATEFNTHEVAEVLSGAGFPKEQVNAQVHILTEVTGELVTKSFLRAEISALRTDLRTEFRTEMSDLKTEFRTEMSDLRTEISEFKTEISEFKTELRTEMSDLKTEFKNEMLLQKKDLTINLGLGQIALMAIMLTVIKFIIV